MTKYQVKKNFDWGSLKLEPLQFLVATEADIEDCWKVTRESTKESIIVSKKALQIQIDIGNISKL